MKQKVVCVMKQKDPFTQYAFNFEWHGTVFSGRIIYCIITRHKITQDIPSLSQKTVHMISRADIVCLN